MASLGFWSDEKWNHMCGATLIGQTHIITAGHCISNKKDMKKRLKTNRGITMMGLMLTKKIFKQIAEIWQGGQHRKMNL